MGAFSAAARYAWFEYLLRGAYAGQHPGVVGLCLQWVKADIVTASSDAFSPEVRHFLGRPLRRLLAPVWTVADVYAARGLPLELLDQVG